MNIWGVCFLKIFTLDHRGKITRNNLRLTLSGEDLLDKWPVTKNTLPLGKKKLNKMRSSVSNICSQYWVRKVLSWQWDWFPLDLCCNRAAETYILYCIEVIRTPYISLMKIKHTCGEPDKRKCVLDSCWAKWAEGIYGTVSTTWKYLIAK